MWHKSCWRKFTNNFDKLRNIVCPANRRMSTLRLWTEITWTRINPTIIRRSYLESTQQKLTGKYLGFSRESLWPEISSSLDGLTAITRPKYRPFLTEGSGRTRAAGATHCYHDSKVCCDDNVVHPVETPSPSNSHFSHPISLVGDSENISGKGILPGHNKEGCFL